MTEVAEGREPSRSAVAPVAMFVFNRPDLTRQVFDVVRAIRPPVLFVCADGPRPDRPDDERLCAETRAIFDDIDWPCEVHWNLREQNLGCGPAMSGGISWVFEHVDRAILLEDDCLPDPTFFAFCTELLERYQDNDRVMQIAGFNWNATPEIFAGDSYGFAGYPIVWGWATWRRAWQRYDYTMSSWPSFRDGGQLAELRESRSRRNQLRREWDFIHSGNGTWDHQWQYAVLSQGGLSVYPAVNLVANLGFRDDATQTVVVGGTEVIGVARSVPWPLRHPDTVTHNAELERFLARKLLRAGGPTVTLLRKVVRSQKARQFLRRTFGHQEALSG